MSVTYLQIVMQKKVGVCMAVGMSVWMWMYACACPPMCRERESKCSKTLTIVKSR